MIPPVREGRTAELRGPRLTPLRGARLTRQVTIGLFAILAACARDSTPRSAADETEPVPLGPASGELAGFDAVSSAVVLPDGRIAILQPDCVVLVDFARARTDTIRREGEGPGEFRGPVALGLGSAGQLTIVDGASRVVSIPTDGQNGTTLRNDRVLPNPYWAQPDTFGTLFLAQHRMGVVKAPASTIDTLYISRLKPTGAMDTIGTFAAAIFQPVATSQGTIALSIMFAPIDAWGVTPAGDIWQLKGIDFHPRWWERSTERWREGTPRRWTPVAVTPEDRGTLPPNPRYPGLDTILRPATEFKTPFLEAVASPEGEIWARVSQSHGAASERIVTFPADGSASDSVLELPRGRHLIGLDATFVYAAVEAGDGTWTIERYARLVVQP